MLGKRGVSRSVVCEAEAVAAADVGAQVDERGPRGVGERGVGVVRALDGDGAVVVPLARGSPGAVVLVHAHGDVAVVADAVVRACLARGRCEVVGALPARPMGRHVVRRDLANAIARTPAVAVASDVGVGAEATLRHRRPFRR